MIPPLTSNGYLPPYLGGNATTSAGMAPYKTTVLELATTFATTPDRREAFNGLLELREMLRSEGIDQGFQWIDGSYVENCEAIRGRPPDDIDVVTFFRRPKRPSQTRRLASVFSREVLAAIRTTCRQAENKMRRVLRGPRFAR